MSTRVATTQLTRLQVVCDVFEGRTITRSYSLETGKEMPEDFVNELVLLIEKHSGTVKGTTWMKESNTIVPFEGVVWRDLV